MMKRRFQKFPAGSVKTGGEIGHRIGLTADKILDHLDIETLFARHFRKRLAAPEVPGGFSGYGMLLDAIVKAASIGAGGGRMKSLKEKCISELIGTQTPDGAVSIFSGTPGIWDNHEQAYIIQAFANDYFLFGNNDALDSALRLGSCLIRNKTGLNLGLEQAFLMLYEASGGKEFLNYCLNEFKLTETPDVYDRMIPVNGTAHVYTFIARVLAQLKLRELTGDDSGELPAGAHELYRRLLEDGCSSISGSCTGGGFWGEIWDRTQIGLGCWGETCASAYLLRCTAEMSALDGNPVYGDLFERVMYNAFFGAQSEDGLRQRYFIPFNEPGEWYSKETYCCPNNLRRMMFELPGAVYFKAADGVAVNLYTESELKTAEYEISQKTDYPESEEILLTVKSESDFALYLRIPNWCRAARILLDGQEHGAQPGTYFRVKGQWSGRTEIRIHLPAPVRYVRGTMAQSGRAAVMRGPLVYAVECERNGLSLHDIALLAIEKPEQCVCEDGGIRIPCCIPNMKHRHFDVLFTRFSAEKRTKTCFPFSDGSDRCMETDPLYK